MLRNMFGCRRDAVRGRWGNCMRMELHDWCSLTDVIGVIIPRGIGGARHVARIGKTCVQGFGGET